MVGAAAAAQGPLVGRIEDSVWPDDANPATSWHVPELVPVLPGPAEPNAFRFDLRRAGMNRNGRAGLDATVTLRLRAQPGTAALAAQAAGANLRAIAPDSVQVTLAVPFRDGEGQTRQQLFPAEVEVDGDNYRVTVRLIDDWARLAYGALAHEGFQSRAAELRVQSDLDGLARVDPAALNLTRLGKLQRLPLRRTSRASGAAARATGKGLRDAMITLAPMAAMLAIRPTLVDATPVSARERPAVVRRRFSVARTPPLEMPCALHGALYRETTDAGEIAIGCREAFRLGETELRLYRALPEHSDASLSVLASLTQPGRFQVVPRRYVICRHPAGDGDRALKPTATLYSALNADHADQNLCVLMAALTPDLDPGRLRALAAALTLGNGTPPVLSCRKTSSPSRNSRGRSPTC